MHEIAADADHQLGGWPTAEDVDKLCWKANGLFIWAVVACNSIGDRDLDTIEQFDELVSEDVLRDTRAVTEIDELFLKVVSKCCLNEPRAQKRYRECFGGVLCIKRPLSSADLNELLDVPYVFPTLRTLAPVLRGLLPRDSNAPIQIIHGSLRHFATQGNENYTIVESEHNSSLALGCLRLIQKQMPLLAEFTQWLTDGVQDTGSNPEDIDGDTQGTDSDIQSVYSDIQDTESAIPTPPQNAVSTILHYACEFLVDHLCQVKHVDPELLNALELFIQHDLYGWLAVCVMLGEMPRYQISLQLGRGTHFPLI